MKMNKNIWIVVIAIIAIAAFMMNSDKQAQANVSSATVSRSLSQTNVKGGASVALSYTTANTGTGSWGVLVSDNINGGCEVAGGGTIISQGWLSSQQPPTLLISTPEGSGTCTFNGIYTFATSTDKSVLGSNSISYCQDECISGDRGCTSNTQRWYCSTSGTCNKKNTVTCSSGNTCDYVTGNCAADCDGLKSDALSKVTTWQGSPTSTNKNNALTAIASWAVSC